MLLPISVIGKPTVAVKVTPDTRTSTLLSVQNYQEGHAVARPGVNIQWREYKHGHGLVVSTLWGVDSSTRLARGPCVRVWQTLRARVGTIARVRATVGVSVRIGVRVRDSVSVSVTPLCPERIARFCIFIYNPTFRYILVRISLWDSCCGGGSY